MYTKGFTGRRYYKRNGTSYTKKSGMNNYNNRLRKLENELRGVKRKTDTIEYKFSDQVRDQGPVLSGGSIQPQIFTIPTGDDDQSRDGKKITLSSISVRFQYSLPSSLSFNDTDESLRVILLIDKQANGALPGVGDILELIDIQGHRNLDETIRFRTIMDRTWSINSTAGAWNGTVTHFGAVRGHDSFYKKLNLTIFYSGDAGTIADIVSNNIVMLYISEQQKGNLKANIRVRYLDA